MNLLNFNHSIPSIFIISFRVYKKYFVSILFLTIILMGPAFLLGISGWSETESIIFFLSAHILEGAICLGVIGTAFGTFFPSIGILRNFRSTFLFGSLHIAILQYLLFITGVIGLTLPFPLSIIAISLWLVGMLMTYIAQPVFAIEGIRGMGAMLRSIKLVRNNLSFVFFVVVISTVMQFLIFALMFTIFMPDLNLNIENNESKGIQILLSDILSDSRINMTIRYTQYFVSLLFYPFASLVCTFLYFDISQKENPLNMDHLEQMSNKLFGTPIGVNQKSKEPSEDDFVETKRVNIISPDDPAEDQ